VAGNHELRGNSAFTFYFNDNELVRPLDYGLVEWGAHRRNRPAPSGRRPLRS